MLREGMPTHSPPGSKRAYPEGRKIQMTSAWKERVKARLVELGKDQLWLEAELKCGKGMVSRLLNSSQQTSKLVEPICRALDIAPPMVEAESDDELEFLEGYRDLQPDEREHLRGIVQSLRKRRN